MEISEYMTVKWIVLFLSAIATVFAWAKIIKSNEHWILKTIQFLIAMFPVLGPILYFTMFNPPKKQPVHMRATLNHYGTGGRFSGGGTRRFNYDPIDDQIAQAEKEESKEHRAPKKRKRKK